MLSVKNVNARISKTSQALSTIKTFQTFPTTILQDRYCLLHLTEEETKERCPPD